MTMGVDDSSQRPETSRERVFAYVHFDMAAARLAAGVGRRRIQEIGASELRCLGFPTLIPSAETLRELSSTLGVAVTSWGHALESERYAAVWAAMSDESNEIDRTAPLHPSRLPWSRLRANDRVLYRMVPPALLEAMLADALEKGEVTGIIVPWIAAKYDLVERHGMLGMDAPAHELVEVLKRLGVERGIAVHALMSDMECAERGMINRAAAGMCLARHTLIATRAIRDTTAARNPVPFSNGTGTGTTIGYLVGGASQWNMLRPLAEYAAPTHRQFLLSHDIFRTPTARRTLRAAGVPFTPLEGELGPIDAVRSLLQTIRNQGAIRRDLNDRGLRPLASDRICRLLDVDLAALPELDVFVASLERAIRRRNIDILVSANCVDSYLGAATEACHRLGIRHACIQNAAFEAVRLPILADCDAYFAESRRFATFMREAGSSGEVHSIGLPYYDRLVGPRQSSTQLRQELGIAPGKQLIGVTTQTDLIDFSTVLEELVQLTERRKDVAVVVKLHPREDASAYAAFGERLRAQRVGGIVHHMPFEEFLGSMAVLVSVVSTTIHWAILSGTRPFSWLIPTFAMFADAVDYMRPSVTFGSPDASRVVNAIERYLDTPEERDAWEQARREFIDEFSTGADGQSCRRILLEIERLAGTPVTNYV